MSNDLIARLEAATGPDRELDAAIALSLRCPNWREIKPWEKTNGWARPDNAWDAWSCLFYDTGGNPDYVPAYTASIDAALTLVPEGWTFCLETHLGGRASVNMWNPQGYISLGEHGGFDPIDAATPAYAIVIAALKAKENSNGS